MNRSRIIVFLVISNLLAPDVFGEIIFQKEEVAIYREILHQGRGSARSQVLIYEESTGNTLHTIDHAEQTKLMEELNSQEEILNDWKEKNSRRQIIDAANNNGDPDSFVSKTPTYGFDSGSIEFKEHTFSVDQLPSFRSYRIKLLLTGTSQTYVPRVKDLRVIALA